MSAGTLGRSLATVLGRELERMALQIEAYPDDAGVWRLEGSVKNSPGTLALHAAGNLNAYVGAVLGGTGYVRDRDAEFGDRDVPREEVVRRLREARAMVEEVLSPLDDATLLEPYPGPSPPQFGPMTTAAFLIHLTWHLGWHEGQMDYHRRILYGGDAV